MVKSGDVQKLRDLTSAGVLDCKKALEEANGDLEIARKIIFEKDAPFGETESPRAVLKTNKESQQDFEPKI